MSLKFSCKSLMAFTRTGFLSSEIAVRFFLLLCLILLPSPSSSQQQQTDSRDSDGDHAFNPNITILVVVLISSLVFLGVFSLYLRRSCYQNGMINPLNLRSVRSRRAQQGLPKEVIDTFPTFVYSAVKEHKLGTNVLECAVCICEFEDDELLRFLPKCKHVFHPECIDLWLQSHITCPVCRSDLSQESGPVPLGQILNIDAPAEETPTLENQVAITVDKAQPKLDPNLQMEILKIDQNPIVNRPVRSRSTRPPPLNKRFPGFPRSHSTGHSLIRPGDNYDKFTLQLPEEVMKKIMKDHFNRSINSNGVLPEISSHSDGKREGSSRGKRPPFGRFDRAARSDRWGFKIGSPSFWRSFSVRSQGKEDSVRSEGKSTPTIVISSPAVIVEVPDEPSVKL